MPCRLALALVFVPGLALAQATSPDPGEPAPVPPSFGDPDERASPNGPAEDRGPAGGAGIPLEDRPATPMREGPGEGGGRADDHGSGMGHGHDGMRHGPERMRMHHGMMRHGMSGQARIAVAWDDRRLTIACGDTSIAECVEGARPLLEFLR